MSRKENNFTQVPTVAEIIGRTPPEKPKYNISTLKRNRIAH